MKKLILFFTALLILCIHIYGQGVAINNTSNEADNSAMLDISATDKGILIPRMNESQRTGITTPATGLLVYQNDATEGFYYYDGTIWTKLVVGTDNMVSSQWTTNGSNIHYNTGKVGIGVSAPHALLHLSDEIDNRKIILHENVDNDHEFYGFGVNSSVLRYQVNSAAASHVFYSGVSNIASMELFRIKGTGQVAIPALNTPGVLLNNASGEISSSIGTNGQMLTTDGSGGCSWANPYSGLTNFTESNYTYDTQNGVKLLAVGSSANVDFVISTKGSGAVLAQQPDGTSTGGNNRGSGAVDLQMSRSHPSQVASGIASSIIGGSNNTTSGYASTAMGVNNLASGDLSTAIGVNNEAVGATSIAMGENTEAREYMSIAMGYTSIASAGYSTAIGCITLASGDYSTAMGASTRATGSNSTALGANTEASGNNSTAMGLNTVAIGGYSTAMGKETIASGRISTAFGNNITAPSAFETALGRFNTDYTPISLINWNSIDRLFVIGNGTDNSLRSDAFTILKNANTIIGGSLTINANKIDSNYTFPIERGLSGQVLSTNVSGTLSWTTPVTNLWQSNGSNIYRTSGNIGIGITSPHAPLQFSSSTENRKIVLFEDEDNEHEFYGLGINSFTLRYQIPVPTASHVFYSGTSVSTSSELFRIKGNGQIAIPALNTAGILLNNASGEISSSVGTNGQVLTTNDSGGINWVTLSLGTVTDVSGTAPIVSSGGTDPVISINPATVSAAGSMSAADKTKLDGLANSQWTTNGSNIHFNTGNVGIGTILPHAPLQLSSTTNNRKIVLYENENNDHEFYGLGVNDNTFRYQVKGTAASHVFYAGISNTNSSELFKIKGNGQITIPALSTAGVVLNNASGEISSSVGTNGQVLTTDVSGIISWANPYSGLINFTESNYTYDSKTGVELLATNSSTNIDFVISPKGTGSILAQQPNGTATGGNNRGDGSVDLQLTRTSATQVASGGFSTIVGGVNNTANGTFSTAIGNSNEASGNSSIAMGNNSTASGYSSTAIGDNNVADDYNSLALGYHTVSTGQYSTTMGNMTTASGHFSTAMGRFSVANGENSTAMGYWGHASGDYSTVMGQHTNAPSAYETAIGRYNIDYTPANPTDWNSNERLFVIGNGTGSTSRSNALTVLKNGNIGIGTDSPEEKLEVSGNTVLNGSLNWGGTSTFSLQTYNINIDGIDSYTPGLYVAFKANITSPSGAIYLSINDISDKYIKHANGSLIAEGDIHSDGMIVVIYDGTEFRWISD